MKKFLLSLLAVAMIASGASATGNDDTKSPTGVAVLKSGSTFKVIYKGDKEGTVKVTIYDAASKTVFSETLRKVESFVRPYNFSSLPEGDYTIEVADQNGKQVEKIGYYKGVLKRYVNLKKLAAADSRYLLTVTNKGKESLTIEIFNNAGRLVFSDKQNINGDFGKVYNLKGLPGDFSFQVTDSAGATKTVMTRE
jgi:hypothetical protein